MRVLNRRHLLLGIDLVWVAVSPFAALFIRDNFAIGKEAFAAAIVYAFVGLAIATVVFPVSGLNRTLWRYTSLPELVRLLFAVTLTLLLALFTIFANSRLEDISRSLPLIQWLFLVAAMTGTRLAIRVWRERSSVPTQPIVRSETEHVLLVGVNWLAELYLRAIAELAPQKFSVVGLLASGTHLKGRLLRSHKVLGPPHALTKVILELEVHGTTIDRVVVAEALHQLSAGAREALLEFERSSQVRMEWLHELLGLGGEVCAASKRAEDPTELPLNAAQHASSMSRRYRYVKRLMDLFAATLLILFLAPMLSILAILTAMDVGFPVVFWQARPGRWGRPFKLYKFRTMRAAHDASGNRIPDQYRASRLGELVRRMRLDELPQLYNILVGEMSFVGPRPLLLVDHAPATEDRLLVRPGLTGWAQVNGGRELSPEDKAALDIWYIQHASALLDLRIALGTLVVLFSGEHINQAAVLAAREARIGCQPGRAGEDVTDVIPLAPKLAARWESAA